MTNKIKRGRTDADSVPAMRDKGLVSGSRDETAHSSGRPERVSMGNSKKLDFPERLKEDGFYYRWFQDKDSRIAMAMTAYYEIVVDEAQNNFRREVGLYPMVLMRLPQKYRDDDIKLKRDRVRATMDEEAALGHNEYSPNGRDSAISRSSIENPYS